MSNNQLDALISRIYFGMKLYMFRAVPLAKTCRVSCQNKYVKLVHLFGLIIKKFVTVHGHMNIKVLFFYVFPTMHHLIVTLYEMCLSVGMMKQSCVYNFVF